MPAISPADGPVAVTGASGYIGSWVVRDLLGEGYRVRACVRDAARPEKVDHLLDLADGRRGRIEIHEGDLWKRGSYDRPFADCAAVIHVAAPLGYNGENPQQTYDGCFVQTEHVLGSILKAGTVQRVVYTSSFAAVTYPCPGGYVFTERDWADRDTEAYGGAWSTDNISCQPRYRVQDGQGGRGATTLRGSGAGRRFRGHVDPPDLRHRTGHVCQPRPARELPILAKAHGARRSIREGAERSDAVDPLRCPRRCARVAPPLP